MEEILEKGNRLKHPKTVNVQLRPEVYEWLSSIRAVSGRPVGYVIRALVEDAYDYGEHPELVQEVPGND